MKKREQCRVLVWGAGRAVEARLLRALAAAPSFAFEVTTVSGTREAMAALAAGGVEVVLLAQPSRLAQLRARHPEVPVVLVTAPGQEEAGMAALGRGAAEILPGAGSRPRMLRWRSGAPAREAPANRSWSARAISRRRRPGSRRSSWPA